MAGEREELTRDEIVRSLQTNVGFVFNFAIDNNYTGLVSALNANNFSPDDEAAALENLKFLYEFDRPKLVKVLSEIQYENNPNNWTGNLDDVFRPAQEEQILTTRSGESGSIWGSILGGLGGLLTGVSGSLSGGGTGTLSVAQIEAARRAAEAQTHKGTKHLDRHAGAQRGGQARGDA